MTRLRAISHLPRDEERGVLVIAVIAALLVSVGLARVSPALLAATLAVGAFFVLALRDLSIGMVGIALSVPIQNVASLDLHVGNLAWTKLVVLATLAAWAVRVVTGASKPRFDGLAIALACYVVVLGLSIIEARNLSAWAEETYRWTVALAVYVIAVETLSGIGAVRRIIVATAGSLLVLAVYAAWQVLTGAGPETFSIDGVTRAYGTFGEPNPFAGYLEMTTPLLVAVVLSLVTSSERESVRRAFGYPTLFAALLGAIVGTGTLVATQSRGGYLGFVAGTAVAVWVTGGKVRWLGTVGGGMCLAALLLTPYGGGVTARFRAESLTTRETQVTTGNFAAQERSAHWRAAVNMARTSPILGIGAGNFNERYREMTTVWRFRIPRGHAHNAYLQALAQAGIVGLFAYLALLVVVAARIVRSLKRANDPVSRSIVIGVASVSVAVAVHNLVEYLHVLSLGLQLSIVWALLAFVDRQMAESLADRSMTVPAA